MVHLQWHSSMKKNSKGRVNIAISKQKPTFIQIGCRNALRISLLADYKRIFNERLQPRGK